MSGSLKTRWRALLTITFWLSLIACLFSASERDRLPDQPQILQDVLKEPVQTPLTDPKSFTVTANNRTYTVEPLFNYELYGLVVSRHHSDSPFDFNHETWNDYLNIADLCVVYGTNIFSGVYKRMGFSSRDYQCLFKFTNSDDAGLFSGQCLSNNHLLTNVPSVKRKIKQARPGDQVYFKGYLASYYLKGKPERARGSSTSREDRGNGACETIFLQDFQILKAANTFWRQVFSLSCIMLFVIVTLLVDLPAVLFAIFKEYQEKLRQEIQ